MMNKPNGQQGPDTRWHYLGPDNEMYGPYTSKDMLFWLTSGYFNESLALRTENENQYHTLGEWTSIIGTHPFSMPIHSMDALLAQINQIRPPPGPMMIMPPGLAPPFPPPVRFPQFMPIPPMMHQMGPNGPNGQGQTQHQMHSQPPSEPIDGSLSHTPDSENEVRNNVGAQNLQNQNTTQFWFAELGLSQPHPNLGMVHGHQNQQQQQQQQRNVYVMAEGPKLQHAQTETERVHFKDSSCQTEPIKINPTAAARLLTEMIGQLVVIN